MNCDIMATAVVLLVLACHCISATGIAIVGGSIPHTICPGSRDTACDLSSLRSQDHPAATETEEEEENLKMVGMLENGDMVSVSMPKTATEEDVISLLRKNVKDTNTEAVALAARLVVIQRWQERTRYWFELGGARAAFDKYLESLVRLAEDRPVSVLEIGSFEGGSALWFAQHLLKHPESSMVCVDTWEGSPEIGEPDMHSVERRFRSNMSKTGKGEHIRVVKGDSLLSLASLVAAGRSSSFDVIYVDASHQMADALADCLLSFRLLKVGGTLIIDDEANFRDVAAATAALESALGGGLQILHREEQVVARKLSDRWASPGLTTFGEDGYQSIEKLLVTDPRW